MYLKLATTKNSHASAIGGAGTSASAVITAAAGAANGGAIDTSIGVTTGDTGTVFVAADTDTPGNT